MKLKSSYREPSKPNLKNQFNPVFRGQLRHQLDDRICRKYLQDYEGDLRWRFEWNLSRVLSDKLSWRICDQSIETV